MTHSVCVRIYVPESGVHCSDNSTTTGAGVGPSRSGAALAVLLFGLLSSMA